MNIKKTILGTIIAILSFAIVVYVIETEKSLSQLFLGFIIFIFPIIFISSFKSNAATFIFVLSTLFYFYIGVYKFEYFDSLFGLLLALIIGGAIAYYRIYKYSLFSPNDFKNEAIDSKDNL